MCSKMKYIEGDFYPYFLGCCFFLSLIIGERTDIHCISNTVLLCFKGMFVAIYVMECKKNRTSPFTVKSQSYKLSRKDSNYETDY